MHVFNGMLTVILQAGEEAGTLELQATAKGVKSGSIRINVKPVK
jgi:beta-galactosidase